MLERQRVIEREHLLGGNGDQLAVRAVGVLTDDGNRVAVLETRVDHDAIARCEALDTFTDGLDDARAVRTQDARLRDGRETLAHPDVEVVQRRRAQADQDLTGCRARDPERPRRQNLRSAVLVDPDRLHGTIFACAP